VIALSRRFLDIMRREHGAVFFWGAVPVKSRRVIMFTRLMGWKLREVRDFPEGRLQIFSGE